MDPNEHGKLAAGLDSGCVYVQGQTVLEGIAQLRDRRRYIQDLWARSAKRSGIDHDMTRHRWSNWRFLSKMPDGRSGKRDPRFIGCKLTHLCSIKLPYCLDIPFPDIQVGHILKYAAMYAIVKIDY